MLLGRSISNFALEGGENRPADVLIFYSTTYEVHYQPTDNVGANMARFAIGSISTFTGFNRQIDVDGMVPHLGSSLQVHWYYVIPVLVGICAFHLALVLLGR